MPGRSRGLVVGLWVATAVAAFGLGRFTAAPPKPPAGDDLASSIRLALGEGDPLERLGRSAGLLERLAPDDLPEVAAVYERMIPLIEPWELASYFAAWARFDPAAALDHALSWPLRGMQEQREIGVRTAIRGWALLDPDKARRAAEQIAADHPRLRLPLWRGLVGGWVHSRRGHEGLAAFLAELRPKHQRDEAVRAAAAELVRGGGVDPALAWAESILADEGRDAELKRAVFAAAADAAARWEPQRTALWAAEHAEASYAQDGLRVVAGRFAQWDGAAAMAWLDGIPAGEPREKAVREAFSEWTRGHPVGAEAWLDSGAETALRDPALEVRAEQLAARRPEDALAWCGRIGDPARQRSCLVATARSWYGRDAVAAEAWLQQSPLDEEARRRIRRAPRPQTTTQRGGPARPGRPRPR